MKSGLWGHALLLASKMDSRTHARVMTRCAAWTVSGCRGSSEVPLSEGRGPVCTGHLQAPWPLAVVLGD